MAWQLAMTLSAVLVSCNNRDMSCRTAERIEVNRSGWTLAHQLEIGSSLLLLLVVGRTRRSSENDVKPHNGE